MAEYRLYAGLAAYQRRGVGVAIERLAGSGPASHRGSGDLSPEQELLRLTALVDAWADLDPARSNEHAAARDALLERHRAGSHYRATILPQFRRLARRQ